MLLTSAPLKGALGVTENLSMNFREYVGLALLVVATILIPVGQLFSRSIWVGSFLLFVAGAVLFYTERMVRKEERLDKEATGGSSSGPTMPADIHNYTGWRSGGRRDTTDNDFSGGGDGGD